MSVRSSGWRRAAQKRLVHAARRSRLFPVTVPDRLGDDDALAGARLDETVLVYFPDTQESLYQIEQWYAPLKALHQILPVVVICQDSRTAARIRAGSSLRVLTIARYGRLDALLSRSNLRIAMYVNHSPRNFECLRFTSLTHVYVGHGDSDKGVSASNQIKAYDFCLVAGRAAVDRIAANVPRYDAARRCVVIGQPQLDGTGLLPQSPTDPDTPLPVPARPRVAYAPTWEGAQPSVAYSSVLAHGPQIVRSLLADGSIDITYRPHPLIGVTSGDYAGADAEIRRLLAPASTARHRVDVDVPMAHSLRDAHLLVCDVSGVAVTWLATGRPLVVVRPELGMPAQGSVGLDDYTVGAPADGDWAGDVRRALERQAVPGPRLRIASYYLSELTDGHATQRFIGVLRRLADGDEPESDRHAEAPVGR